MSVPPRKYYSKGVITPIERRNIIIIITDHDMRVDIKRSDLIWHYGTLTPKN